jgi:predicted lipid-binding transport protein (Tim44 family)
MSSRKAATARNGTKTRAKSAPSATAPAEAAPASAPATPVSAAAEQLAADIQRALKTGDHEVVSPEALQKLMTAACRLYSAQAEAGSTMLPVGEVTPTDIMVTASGLMRAGNLAVFELGMWQSWTGR